MDYINLNVEKANEWLDEFRAFQGRDIMSDDGATARFDQQDIDFAILYEKRRVILKLNLLLVESRDYDALYARLREFIDEELEAQ